MLGIHIILQFLSQLLARERRRRDVCHERMNLVKRRLLKESGQINLDSLSHDLLGAGFAV